MAAPPPGPEICYKNGGGVSFANLSDTPTSYVDFIENSST